MSETDEIERLRDWHEKSVPIIAALAIYGEGVNVPALVEKARALNEATTNEGAEIWVRGKLVGHGTGGMLAALDEMLPLPEEPDGA